MRLHSIPLAAFVAATLAACNTVSAGTEAAPSVSAAAPAPAAENPVAVLAIDALAAELKIPRNEITVDSISAVDWPDSSVGCPQPGRAYLQVITPGHRIVLRAKGGVHVVHEAKGRAFVCSQAKAMGGITQERELVFGKQMLAAQRDLATRLGVSAKDIRPVSSEAMTWDDASLGCPEPGVQYAQAETSGWVLTLRHANRNYTYHTDLTRTIACPSITDK